MLRGIKNAAGRAVEYILRRSSFLHYVIVGTECDAHPKHKEERETLWQDAAWEREG